MTRVALDSEVGKRVTYPPIQFGNPLGMDRNARPLKFSALGKRASTLKAEVFNGHKSKSQSWMKTADFLRASEMAYRAPVTRRVPRKAAAVARPANPTPERST